MPGGGLSQAYDEVVRYRCCEPATFGARGNRDMVRFRARRDGTWYCVEMGDDDQAGRAGLEGYDGEAHAAAV